MLRFSIAILLATAIPLVGQQSSTSKGVTVSLIPVGSNSDAYWEGDGPGMRAIAIDPDAAPPRTLTVRTREGLKTIPTTLNRPTPALPVREGRLRVFANGDVDPEKEEPPLFGEYTISGATGHYDVFLNRDPKRKNWEDAQAVTLSSSPSVFPLGSIRLINLCNENIIVRVGNENIKLAARKVKVHQPAESSSRKGLTAVQAAHADANGNPKIFLRTGVPSSPDERTNVIFYPGREGKSPCKATWFQQIPPVPLVEKKEES